MFKHAVLFWFGTSSSTVKHNDIGNLDPLRRVTTTLSPDFPEPAEGQLQESSSACGHNSTPSTSQGELEREGLPLQSQHAALGCCLFAGSVRRGCNALQMNLGHQPGRKGGGDGQSVAVYCSRHLLIDLHHRPSSSATVVFTAYRGGRH